MPNSLFFKIIEENPYLLLLIQTFTCLNSLLVTCKDQQTNKRLFYLIALNFSFTLKYYEDEVFSERVNQTVKIKKQIIFCEIVTILFNKLQQL